MQTLLTNIQNNDVSWNEIVTQETVRIMVLNQNKDELRANGGFPGSTFFITLTKGKIQAVTFEDIYALDWDFVSTTPSPAGIDKFFATSAKQKPISLYVRDANYFPDFQESATTINQLLIQSGNEPIDILIGIHSGLLEDIVGVFGEIQVNNTLFTKQNISELLSLIVESKIAKITSPKDIIRDIVTKMKDQLPGKERQIAQFLLQHIQT